MRTSEKTLLLPVTLGDFYLQNKFVLAPLTRCRCDSSDRVPTQIMATYYGLRSSFGLLITEATSVHPMGVGYPRTPGIWSDEQVRGWAKICDKVHENGGKIVMQLWHVGRVSDPMYLDGKLPIAPSAVEVKSHVRLVTPQKPYVTPRALETREVKHVIDDYITAAKHAKLAGFDGIEIHGANGYLFDQFFHPKTNLRVDEYGGSIANRCRPLLEAIGGCLKYWPRGKIGLHLSPQNDLNDMGGEIYDDQWELYEYLLSQKLVRDLAFIFLRERSDLPDKQRFAPWIKKNYNIAVIINEGLSFSMAHEQIKQHGFDAVAFGKNSISNPDLVERYERDLELSPYDPSTFYTPGASGYI